jgi:hypothetical protein
MNPKEDQKWQGLLQLSAPTFAGDAEPPYGMITSTLARLKAGKQQQEDVERIGWRALLASLAALAVAATVTLSVSYLNQGVDFEPGVRGVVQMENIQVS